MAEVPIEIKEKMDRLARKYRNVPYKHNGRSLRGLDCLDGTPLLDIKPDRCAFSPKAPPKPN